MFRFLHTSDLHLGKRFGQMPEELRGRLTEARHQQIGILADLAIEQKASHILVAGDIFDAENPSPQTRRQALQAMAAQPTVKWVLMPGNHDSLVADQLWSSVKAECPGNILLALEVEPIDLQSDVYLLPAPCTARRAGRDLTVWMDDVVTPEGALRIGLAHGPIQSFDEDGADGSIIDPSRAKRARLDYLALGDWHGLTEVNERTWYSGTPEPDRFKNRVAGKALSVTVEGSGEAPKVEAINTGCFDWQTHELSLLSGEDVGHHLASALPATGERRQMLLQLQLAGRLQLSERSGLIELLKQAVPDFAHLEWDETGLETVCEADDLDQIDKGGILRQTANDLLNQSQDNDLPAEERLIAKAALNRLYDFTVDLT